MNSELTTYRELFTHGKVREIVIPNLQRDYAQGRSGDRVKRIRSRFLSALKDVLITEDRSLELDFIYGTLRDGALEPLDGQQRLTTLFLLHWYLAFRTGRLSAGDGWWRFRYETRPSARLFCERLVEETDLSESSRAVDVKLSGWLEDRAWYQAIWRYDPTIQSMLTMIDAIDGALNDADHELAWQRLDAVSFHLLPIDSEEMGQADVLYIRMNARGRPLTEFENFKALFERALGRADSADKDRFAHSVDGAWADVLWQYRGSDDIIDDEYLRYFTFLVEVCEWRSGLSRTPASAESIDILARAESVFVHDKHADRNRRFLFDAFDCWVVANDVPSEFAALFTTAAQAASGLHGAPSATDSPEPSRPVLFTRLADNSSGAIRVDLFGSCCAAYGETAGRNRKFSLSDTLLLYGVILQRISVPSVIEGTDAIPSGLPRLRVLRNLCEASAAAGAIDEKLMGSLLEDVHAIIDAGHLDDVKAFDRSQVEDEKRKLRFLLERPEFRPAVEALEDHELLRGALAAFDLDERIADRARAFLRLFPLPFERSEERLDRIGRALLAAGNYSRAVRDKYAFGGRTVESWRTVLSAASARNALRVVLDRIIESDGELDDMLVSMAEEYVERHPPTDGLDWRWYFVRYPAMRETRSGRYYWTDDKQARYRIRMLKNAFQLNGTHYDPFLLAMAREAGAENMVEGLAVDHWVEPPEIRLTGLDLTVSNLDESIRIRSTNGQPVRAEVASVLQGAIESTSQSDESGTEWHLPLEQTTREGMSLDVEDRVALGSRLIQRLIALRE